MIKLNISTEVVKDLEAHVRDELDAMSAFSEDEISNISRRTMVSAIAEVLGQSLMDMIENMSREMILDIGTTALKEANDNVQ